jgi:hypothetical protein
MVSGGTDGPAEHIDQEDKKILFPDTSSHLMVISVDFNTEVKT